MLTEYIVGAEAFDKGKASTISGIQTNDATGKITVKLVAPYGPFLNVLAFPAAGLVPASTPMKSLPNDAAAGRRAVRDHEHVVPNQSFSLVLNPHFAAHASPACRPGTST